MTKKTALAYLADAHTAAQRVIEFTLGKSVDDYLSDKLLASAVEPQLIIVGEALGNVRRLDPALAAEITDLKRAVAFRNILTHQYATVDDVIVWSIVEEKLPATIQRLAALLGLSAPL